MEIPERLISAAVDLLASGPEAVQTRKVAAQAGTSTMAVYTHFGGISGLVQAIAREGFLRLSAQLAAVPRTDEPLTDLVALGQAYREHARGHPELYRLMFGVTAIQGHRPRLGDPGKMDRDTPAAPLATDAIAAFDALVSFVEAAANTGQLSKEPPLVLATQLWSAMHGHVLLEIAGFVGPETEEQLLTAMMAKILAAPLT
jgi:AcrR family transcriptional regulator